MAKRRSKLLLFVSLKKMCLFVEINRDGEMNFCQLSKKADLCGSFQRSKPFFLMSPLSCVIWEIREKRCASLETPDFCKRAPLKARIFCRSETWGLSGYLGTHLLAHL